MTITPEEQIWLVVEAIANASEITASGENLLIDPSSLKDKVSEIELGRILNKMQKDHQIIEIFSSPSDLDLRFGGGSKCYSLKITDQAWFKDFLNNAHMAYSGGINKLASENFLAVCDVAMDILEKLQMVSGSKVAIPLLRSIVRFPNLMPADGINMRDRYCDYRWQALEYMKNRGYITSFKIEDSYDLHRWEKNIIVQIDRYNFDKFYNKLIEIYQIRVVEPAKKSQKTKSKSEKQIPNLSTLEQQNLKVEIVGMPVVQTKSVEENIIAKNKKVISLPKFPTTDWKKVEWRFLSERDVIIGTPEDLKPSDFQALGFENETTGKPDSTWLWLFGMANRGGESEKLPKPIPDITKQKKRKVSTLLKKLFKNEEDPFYDPSETQTYRLKIKLLPPAPIDDRPAFDPSAIWRSDGE